MNFILKNEVCIKNRKCYYFDNIIKLEDFDLDNTLTDEKSHEAISSYVISYKNLTGPKPLRFIRIYDGTRY